MKEDIFIPEFIQIPRQVFCDKDLSAVDMLVYGMVYWYKQLRGERCFASNKAFASILSVGTQKVSESISRLARKEYVRVVYDDATGHRQEIIPLIVYTRHTPSGVGGVRRAAKEHTPSGEQKNNNQGEQQKKKENAPLRDAFPKADSFFNAKKEEYDAMSMTAQEFVLMCRGSQYRHIRLIAEYADEKKLTFATRGQWREFGKRNMRAARQLVPYTDRQLERAMSEIDKDMKDRPGGFISKWTLETLVKYLDQTST